MDCFTAMAGNRALLRNQMAQFLQAGLWSSDYAAFMEWLQKEGGRAIAPRG